MRGMYPGIFTFNMPLYSSQLFGGKRGKRDTNGGKRDTNLILMTNNLCTTVNIAIGQPRYNRFDKYFKTYFID